ncbi:hypothetical protein [Sphaerospermopsis torques-reginae]|uniref:Uncharacterized protein n=1 Tax=Sphaerospermopsis torques-reginae ITEP-024 TaxID=984208 RepID=A0ABX8WTU5_9CYAN|nr:hypothetical protein [Sphaerospermopsis torques-reginae]QYX29826.1 hypothetical protein K2F26_12580 [Sphaerospermopsis torques-reginae ITEP-024]
MNTKSLHTRLKMALLLHSRESGFAMVIAVSLGLIMILVGLTMTMRSQGDQITASQQKATDQALAAAEQGVVFYQQLINTNRMLAAHPNSTWTTKLSGISPGCSNPGTADPETIADAKRTSWQAVDSTDVTKGQFRLVSYGYTPDNNNPDPNDDLSYYPGKGTLIVEGRMANSTSNNEETKAITRLQVVIPVNCNSNPSLGAITKWEKKTVNEN